MIKDISYYFKELNPKFIFPINCELYDHEEEIREERKMTLQAFLDDRRYEFVYYNPVVKTWNISLTQAEVGSGLNRTALRRRFELEEYKDWLKLSVKNMTVTELMKLNLNLEY